MGTTDGSQEHSVLGVARLAQAATMHSQQAAHARAVSDGVTDGRAPALRRAAARDGASKEKSVKMGLMAPRGQEDKFRGAGGARRQTKCQFVDG